MIEIKHVSKLFEGAQTVRAVNDVSLTVKDGEIFGIIGLSGAGKSTLIRCINRLETPTSGEILLNGENILAMNGKALRATRKRVSMIFQQFNLLMQKTVARNVRYPLEISHVSTGKANSRVRELLEIVGLSDKAGAYPAQLSGGQKQRVAIARALATDPEVLLCDEATSALDPMTTQSILALLQDINRRLGITVIVITHEMAVIRQICTHVAILDGGVIAEEGSVDDVFTHTKSAAGRRLFGIVQSEADEKEITPGVDALRIVFDGDKMDEPMLAECIISSSIPVNILYADINRLNGKRYGQMLIERPAPDADATRLIAALRERGLTVEEVDA